MKFLALLILALFSIPASAGESKVTLDPAKTIVLAGPITDSVFMPVMEGLDKITSKSKEVDVIISSPGGSVIVGSLIIDKMEQLKNDGVKFRCVVRDVAASMAFQILLHCDERYATPHSFLLWHPVRVFMRGALTADAALGILAQLQQADQVALHDLIAYLPMSEADLLWHFKNETLHQAFNLLSTAPGFFKKVTNSVVNLYPKKPAVDTAEFFSPFGMNQILYIHERFLKQTDGGVK